MHSDYQITTVQLVQGLVYGYNIASYIYIATQLAIYILQPHSYLSPSCMVHIIVITNVYLNEHAIKHLDVFLRLHAWSRSWKIIPRTLYTELSHGRLHQFNVHNSILCFFGVLLNTCSLQPAYRLHDFTSLHACL